jgi:hypothetical protein
LFFFRALAILLGFTRQRVPAYDER